MIAAPPTAFVVSHPDLGVFLGTCLGLGFWSKIDPVGQDAAVTFPTRDDAQALVAQHADLGHPEDDRPLDAAGWTITEVTPDLRNFATISEIARVGLPAWNPAASC